MGYDRAIVVFSPDGRLFQVEYAREAVKKGLSSLGLIYEDGVILMASRVVSKLAGENQEGKIKAIDNHIGVASSGIVADSRVLVDKSRVKAQTHKLTYEEDIDVTSLGKYIADQKQVYTQYGGIRPYGISFLIGGFDGETPRLFETDPSGSFSTWKAKALGRGAEKIEEHFEKNYKEEMSKEDALKLAFAAMKKAEKDIKAESIELAIIEDGEFNELDHDEVAKLYKKLA